LPGARASATVESAPPPGGRAGEEGGRLELVPPRPPPDLRSALGAQPGEERIARVVVPGEDERERWRERRGIMRWHEGGG
jgi:hypothetical protein